MFFDAQQARSFGLVVISPDRPYLSDLAVAPDARKRHQDFRNEPDRRHGFGFRNVLIIAMSLRQRKIAMVPLLAFPKVNRSATV